MGLPMSLIEIMVMPLLLSGTCSMLLTLAPNVVMMVAYFSLFVRRLIGLIVRPSCEQRPLAETLVGGKGNVNIRFCI